MSDDDPETTTDSSAVSGMPPMLPGSSDAFPSVTPLVPNRGSPLPGGRPSDPSNPVQTPTVASQVAPLRRYIGRYGIVRELGRGGMGVVYLAHQDDLNRDVALKVIPGGPDADPDELRRFRAEAETAANLKHPNIVPVYDVGETESSAYLAMEFVPGGTLHQLITKGALDPIEAARLMEGIARGIHHAHEQGVIHRDLKPSNILISTVKGDDGIPVRVPKITDFGLARKLDKPSNITASGMAVGTPQYMAPEQARGLTGQLGPKTDVYGLGAILYEMLVGYAPFSGGNALETMELVVNKKPVPPGQMRNGIPKTLEAICLKCLEKEPAYRFPTALDLADTLRDFLTPHPMSTRQEPVVDVLPRKVTSFASFSLVVQIVLVFGLAAVLIATRQRPPERIVESFEDATSIEGLKRQLAQEQAASHEAKVRSAIRLCETGNLSAGVGELEGIGRSNPQFAPQFARLIAAWSHPLRRETPGDATSNVPFLSLDSESKQWVSFAKDTIRIYDGTRSHTLPFQGEPVAVANHGGSRRLAIATSAGSVKLIDSVKREEIRTIDAKGPVLAVGFSDGGQTLWISGASGAKSYNVQGNPLQATVVPTVPVRTWAFRDRAIAWLDESGTISVAITKTLNSPLKIAPYPGIRHFELSDDGDRIAAIVRGGEIVLWSRRDNRWTDFGPIGDVTAVVIRPDANLLITGDSAGNIRLWDLPTRTAIGNPIGNGNAIRSLTFSTDGQRLGVIGENFRATTFSLDSLPYRGPLRSAGDGAIGFGVSPHSGDVYAIFADRVARWKNGEWVTVVAARDFSDPPDEKIRILAGAVQTRIDRKTDEIVVATSEKKLHLVSAITGLSLAIESLDPAASPTGIRCDPHAPGGPRAVCFGTLADGSGVVHATDFDKTRSTFAIPQGIRLLEIVPGTSRIWTAGKERKLREWDLLPKAETAVIPLDFDAVSIAVSPSTLLVAGPDGLVVRYDGGRPAGPLQTGTDVRFVRFGREPGTLWTADTRGEWQRWDSATGWKLGPAVRNRHPLRQMWSDGKLFGGMTTAGDIRLLSDP
jgi:serine/threonine protein kinase/WD40 repeat protein